MPVLSDVVIFFNSIAVLIPKEELFGCATIAFSKRYLPDNDLVQVETCIKDINDK